MFAMYTHAVLGKFKIYRNLTARYCNFTWVKYRSKWRLIVPTYEGEQHVYIPPMRFYSLKELSIEGILFYHDGIPVYMNDKH